MTDAMTNGSATPDQLAILEAEIRAAAPSAPEEVQFEPTAPNVAAVNAGDTIHYCAIAAETIRKTGDEFFEVGRAFQAEAHKLADDVETHGAALQSSLEKLKEHSADRLALFERERAILQGFVLPGLPVERR